MKCDITGTRCLFGNNVSHAKNITKTRFLLNLQEKMVYSRFLGKVNIKVSRKGLRIIDKHGGLDEYLLQTLDRKLTPLCKKLKKTVLSSKDLNKSVFG